MKHLRRDTFESIVTEPEVWWKQEKKQTNNKNPVNVVLDLSGNS